jgi:hypothetical protein
MHVAPYAKGASRLAGESLKTVVAWSDGGTLARKARDKILPREANNPIDFSILYSIDR